jgi:hypothetical protein
MLTIEQQVHTLCEKCVKVFGKDNAQPATVTMKKDSVLLRDKVLIKHICDEHGLELWESGWECI